MKTSLVSYIVMGSDTMPGAMPYNTMYHIATAYILMHENFCLLNVKNFGYATTCNSTVYCLINFGARSQYQKI